MGFGEMGIIRVPWIPMDPHGSRLMVEMPYFHIGVSIVEGTPIAGRFAILQGKIPSKKMDDDWGYPDFRKPPYISILHKSYIA